MVTGSAPIEKHVLDFLKICFCCPLGEGYGMTESTASGTLSQMKNPESGTIGGPHPMMKIKLRDIPEMSYLSTDNPPRGEICLFGPCVMEGYFLNPEKTAETVQNGWLFTGDVGQIEANGSVKIIDRAKNIFKLSQGEYIAPEKLENIFVQAPHIMQIWVHGDSLKDHLVAFVYPDPEICGKDFDKEKMKETVFDDILAQVKKYSLNSLETPKQLMLLDEPFTIDNNILTPTMKLKRNVAKEVFKKEIEELYALPMLNTKK